MPNDLKHASSMTLFSWAGNLVLTMRALLCWYQWQRCLALCLLAACIDPTWVRAQEVIVGAPVWFSSGPPPDELPKQKHPLKPAYPDEMRKAVEPGYVIVRCYVDASGKSLALSAEGTQVHYQRAVEAEFRDWKSAPANRGGVAVDAEFWMSVIFNPRLANKDDPGRGPRLLSVAPIIMPDESDLLSGLRGGLPVRLNLDATGAIVGVTPEIQLPDKLLKAVHEALRGWSFAPACHNGLPVAAEVRLPVIVCKLRGASASEKHIPPKPIYRVNPAYPLAMERFGIKGKVIVEFVVDEGGRVRNPVIVNSDNPAFDEPALETVLKWKFEPATTDGRKVSTTVRQSMVFQPWGDGSGGIDIFEVSGKGDQSKLPPELRYDVSPKILGVQLPIYPYGLRKEHTQGKALARMLIDRQGNVSVVKLLSADRPEFGLALVAALEGFTFDPALKDGKPVQHLLIYGQDFDDKELPDVEGDRSLALEKKQPDKILPAETLDAPLKPASRKPPIFPRSAVGSVATGDALIECLIDEKGRVRLPRIIKASDPAFGYSAVQAVAAWWFEPPRKGGKPVITRARIPFHFEREVPSPTTPPKP